MLASFSEFKFYQSFRIPVEEADDLRFLVEQEDDLGNTQYINDAKLIDISVTGLGFSSLARISVGTVLMVSLQFKKHHIDLTGKVVRAFHNTLENETLIYGVELDDEKGIHKFLEQYIMSFSVDRLKECLIDSALKERYTKASDGFEMFSLLLSLFKDITHFGDKEGFLDNMLEEVVRILNAQRASIFLINPESNELEAVAAMGVNKDILKFDYRLGIAGSVFTTGVALNIDTINDSSRFNEAFDRKTHFETKTIICHPIHNREDKVIGVIEVLNKRNQDRFTVEDEKTMKVLALVFSSVFHNYNPISETSMIRRFSKAFDRKYALIGKTGLVGSLRSSIIKLKDLDTPVLVFGEKGVGKSLLSRIIHFEGRRGLSGFEVIHCEDSSNDQVMRKLFGPSDAECVFTTCQGGTILLHEVHELSREHQSHLMQLIKDGGLPGSKISMDVRIMASTTQDLGILVDQGKFDAELYHYLNRAFINVPPLRRRTEDISHLVDYFLRLECKKQGLLLKEFSPKVMEKLKQYDWPGNISELRMCVERAVLYNPKSHVISEVEFENETIPLLDVGYKRRMFGEVPHVSDHTVALKDRIALVEREMILNEIKRNNGNKSKAAKEMGISREALRKKLLLSDEILESLDPSSVEDHEKKAA